MLITLPFFGFHLGVRYQEILSASAPLTQKIQSYEISSRNNKIPTILPIPQGKECESAEYYSKFLQQEFGSSVDINVDKSENWSTTAIQWKRKASEPFIAYPQQVVSVNYVSIDDPKKVNDIYNSLIDKAFIEMGYISDQLNTPVNSRKHSYKKGNTLITVNIGLNTEYAFNHDATTISLNCGIVDSKYDELYNELLSSPDVQAALKESYGENGLKNMIFSIWAINKNDIVTTNISSLDWVGGHGVWFHKEDGKWKKIFEGQNGLPCSVLENLKIEPGDYCFDTSDSSNKK